jgi:WD40 repeat protein
MKKLTLLLAIPILFSCAESSESDSKAGSKMSLTYELDTVRIDSGEDFIHLNWGLTSSDLSTDEKYFYNFKTGAEKLGLEVIDLENLTLERVIPMSLDGPNSIRSPYITRVYLLPDDTYYLSDNYEVYHFDQEGNKLSTMSYAKQEFEGEKLSDDKRIWLYENLSPDGETLVALYGGQKMDEPSEGVAIFDLENKRVSYKATELFKERSKYQTTLYYEGVQPMGASGAAIHLALQGDTLVYSISAQNRIHFYSLQTDSISSKSFTSKYTSLEAKSNYPSRTDSEEEFQEISKEKSKEVNYGPLFFDEQNAVYWRFTKEMDRMKGDTTLFKTVLTAFDSDFNQLHEELLPSDFVLPYKYFARKGMIYLFLNIDDELAFVRLKPNFNR